MDALVEARDRLAELRGTAERLGAIRVDLSGPVGRITIDHPEARSALSVSMMVELADAVLALRAWAGAIVVVSSTDPRAFCAGGHLGTVTRQVGAGEGARTMARAMTTVLDTMSALPVVSVAAVDGIAMGGGAELLTATDFRVVSPEARIHFVHARLGIAPGWGGTARLVRLVGRTAALRILGCARPLMPGECVDLGLVDHRGEGPATAEAVVWLQDLIERAPEAIRAVKRQVVAADQGDRAAEAEAFVEVWNGPAHRAALAQSRHTGTSGR